MRSISAFLVVLGCASVAPSLALAQAVAKQDARNDLAPATHPSVRQTLAPTGHLRVALVSGTPTTFIPGATPAESKGVGFDLGRHLARQLGVPFVPVAYPNPAALMAGLAAGEWDMAFLAATPDRARVLDLTSPLLIIEQTYLVAAGSKITDAAMIDRSGVRIGAPQGGSTNVSLRAAIRNATILPTPGLAAAADMLRDGRIDVFAANKVNLFEIADKLPGSRILPGRIGTDEYVLGVPKSHASGLPWLTDQLGEAKRTGVVSAAMRRASLRGAVEQ